MNIILVDVRRYQLFRSNADNILRIENVQESDTGPYTCVAQNSIGSVERTGEIRVKNHGPRTPSIITKPFDIDVPQSSSIEIPCKTDGEPTPKIQWLKNRVPLELKSPKFKYVCSSPQFHKNLKLMRYEI